MFTSQLAHFIMKNQLGQKIQKRFCPAAISIV
jgi:hypothetical protein